MHIDNGEEVQKKWSEFQMSSFRGLYALSRVSFWISACFCYHLLLLFCTCDAGRSEYGKTWLSLRLLCQAMPKPIASLLWGDGLETFRILLDLLQSHCEKPFA